MILYCIPSRQYNIRNHSVLYCRKDGMHMGTRERILAIRIMEKLQNRPEYARALGIEVCGEMAPPGAVEKKEK